MIRAKLILLAIVLTLSAVLVARASSTTEAYFSDTRAGTITGTLGDWTPLCRFEPGTSKARHWDLKGGQASRVLLIARLDTAGALSLDFGDVPPGDTSESPDVVRIVSEDEASRRVDFAFEGAAAALFGEAGLVGETAVLVAGATERVRVRVAVPEGAIPGEYRGDLVLSLDGTPEPRIPVVVPVRANGTKSFDQPAPQTASPVVTLTIDPSPAPTNDAGWDAEKAEDVPPP